MMPSVSREPRNAASASSSVALTYSARPLSRRNACSGPDAGVVEPGRDRVRVQHLPVLVGEDRRARAVQHAGAARTEARRARRPRRRRAERPGRRGTPRRARSRSSRRRRTRRATSGSRPSASSICSRASRPITACSSRTISGYGCGPDARADQVVRRLDVRDPVADRLARRLLERLRPELDRPHLRAEQAPSARRSAAAGACPRSPCRRRTRGRSARRPSPWRRRAGPRRSRRRSARLPSRCASSAWPSALLSLCAPVCSRSSRFR